MVAADAASGQDAAPRLCGPGSLDPAKIAGKVVVCDRGTYDRVAKSAEVARGGGVGMILVNVTASSLDADKHSVPTVHVNPPATETIKAKVTANPAITVSLVNKDTTGLPAEAQPQIAGFSSRGPLLATDSDLLSRTSQRPALLSWPVSRRSAPAATTSGSCPARPWRRPTWPVSAPSSWARTRHGLRQP